MTTGSKVAFHTLGCKLNYSETSSIADQFAEQGFEQVSFHNNADLYVINTCSVTENADKECRKIVKKAKRTSPDSVVAIIGCYAQLKPDEIAEIDGVDMVLGASEKFRLLDHFKNFNRTQTLNLACDINELEEFIPSESGKHRTRSFLKVQDGCDYSCSFCTIPLARGKSRSDTVENVFERVRDQIKLGTKEIVLSGINLGDFQDSSTGRKRVFTDLAYELDKIPFDIRFRISSIEPNLITDDLIELLANSSKFVPHLHIPMQSGSDNILKKMRRRYQTDLYRDKVIKLKARIPDICIGADVIVGFPGENDSEFNKTVDFIRSLGLSYLHVFSYSERDNTLAADMDEVVPVETRQKRSFTLRTLSASLRKDFYNTQMGKCRPVLFESDSKADMMYGFTDNYVKVQTTYDASLVNEIHDCTITSIDEHANVIIEAKSLAV